MRIKIFSSFCDSQECKNKYEQLCETHKIKNYTDKGTNNNNNNNVYITTNDDYTHAIILNTAMPELKIPKENVLGLAFEPTIFLKLSVDFISYAQKYIGRYFIGDKYYGCGTLPDVFKEHYAYMWHITPLTYIPVKNKIMSIMVSNKQSTNGHKYRHSLVQNILSTDLPIDIYGSGVSTYYNKYSMFNKDYRLKGAFKELEPYEQYHFHICIENIASNAYFSEKITNTLLCGATPIYWGCRSILNYFPNNVILLSGDVNKDLSLLRNILLNPGKYKANINVGMIKNKLNLLKNIEAIFAPEL